MLNKLFGIAIISFICAVSITELSAQINEDQKKIVIVEKVVDNNGNITETKKVLEGEAAEKYLAENKVENLTTNTGRKKMLKVSVLDNNGETKEFNWNGEGEMPAEMKKVLDKESVVTPSDKKHKKIKIIKIAGDNESVEEFEVEGNNLPEDVIKMMEEHGIDSGEITKTILMNNSGGKKVMVIKKESEGIEEVMDLDWEGEELPNELRKILEQESVELEKIIGVDGTKEIKVTASVKEQPKAKAGKAQLGVLIEKNILGVLVAQVVPKSAAEVAGIQVGDIITNVNTDKIIAPGDLINSLKDYQPSDEVVVKFLRAGNSQEVTVKLKERVDPFPFKTWESVMRHGQREIEEKR